MRSKNMLPLFGDDNADGFREHQGSSPELASGAAAKERPALEHDVASEFIFKTLVSKPAVRELGGVSFMTAMTWRSTVKDSQLKALRILKHHLPDPFVATAGRQLACVTRKFHGHRAFSVVVPVPCGHSGRPDCLSFRLGEAVAGELDAAFVAALEPRLVRGSSHPKQSLHFRKPRVTTRVRGRVLVVDDVCTTGRHISLSVAALRMSGRMHPALPGSAHGKASKGLDQGARSRRRRVRPGSAQRGLNSGKGCVDDRPLSPARLARAPRRVRHHVVEIEPCAHRRRRSLF
jgi:hypothetical protein